MMSRAALNGLLIFQIFTTARATFQYAIVIRDEEVFVPCNKPDVYFLDRYFDMSNLHFDSLANGSIYIHGEAIVIRDFSAEKNPFRGQFLKKNRDTWVNTLFNIRRDDTCEAAFDPSEFWYTFTKDIPVEERTCPIYKGKKLTFDVTADLTLDLPDPRLAGEYKAEIQCDMPQFNEVFCANIFVEFYRI